MSRRIFSFVLPLLCTRVLGDMVPTAPGPGDRFKAGNSCTIKWEVDQTGTWTNVTIDLKSGSNDNQTLVTNVVSGLDGSDPALTPFNWTCPEVNPYSGIYFYEFTNNGDTSAAKWTTRFTIASDTDDSVAPENAQQPSGDYIPWGIGQLADGSSSTGDKNSSDTRVDNTQVDFQNLSRSKSQSEFQHGYDYDGDSDTKAGDNDENSPEDDSGSGDARGEKDERSSGKSPSKGEGSSTTQAGHTEDNSAQADSDSEKQENSQSGEASSAATTDSPKDTNSSHTQLVSLKPSASGGSGSGAKPASSTHSTTKTALSSVGKSVQTPSLPSLSPAKKMHPSETTSPSAAAPSALGSCQCAGSENAGLKLSSGSPERQRTSHWTILSPALVVFFVLL